MCLNSNSGHQFFIFLSERLLYKFLKDYSKFNEKYTENVSFLTKKMYLKIVKKDVG